MHQSAAEGAGGLPNRICKKKYDVDSHSAYYVRQYVDQKCLRHLASGMLTCYANCPKRDIIAITADDVRYFCKM